MLRERKASRGRETTDEREEQTVETKASVRRSTGHDRGFCGVEGCAIVVTVLC